MQHNLVIGNISNINKIEGTNKAFITVADHYNRYDKTAKKWVQDVNYVPLQGFIPEGLNLVVGQLISATYHVTQYKDRNGQYQTACDIEDLEVRYNNISKEKREAKTTDAGQAQENAPAQEAAPAEGSEQMPFGGNAQAEAEAPAEEPAKKGKKSAK